jgi:lipoprotein-anchoring transpeptidase ErfK/SrfK
MNTDPESAQQALLKSWRALEQGDRQAARRWAEMAVAQKPDLEEPWLIMAAIGSPRASVAYLNQALQVNPQSERARKGMQWAVERLRKEKGRGRDAGNPSDKLEGERVFQHGASPEPVIRSRVEIQSQATIIQSATGSIPTIDKSLAKYRWSFLSFSVMAVCVTAIWAWWPRNASPVPAFLHVPLSTPLVIGAPNEVDKPTYTPTFTPTFTPTCSSTPTPTFTYTPTPTETYTPTETLTPTETYTPTLTLLPTDAPKPKPTDTPFPFPDYGGVRWIDVDLSQQMLYAYEGSTIVARFLISSGVPAFPTVTGQFHIYIKLISTLMTGDGYYLPNVPFTMYFYKGFGIHGTYWHHNFGHPMSHGCVNMYTPDAEWMFNWASEGTLVNIHY